MTRPRSSCGASRPTCWSPTARGAFCRCASPTACPSCCTTHGAARSGWRTPAGAAPPRTRPGRRCERTLRRDRGAGVTAGPGAGRRDPGAPPTWLADNVARVREQVAEAALAAGRRPEEVRLVAVTKTRPPELVIAAARLGLGELGENRVQEAMEKIPAVNAALARPPSWHLIGTLQTNKVRAALGLFAIIQSV